MSAPGRPKRECRRAQHDGSKHAVIKNFPTPERTPAALAPGVPDVQWRAWPHD